MKKISREFLPNKLLEATEAGNISMWEMQTAINKLENYSKRKIFADRKIIDSIRQVAETQFLCGLIKIQPK